MNSDTCPGFWKDVQPWLVRRATSWIGGERVDIDRQTYQRGRLFADWKWPEGVTHLWPIVFVNGRGHQSTKWLDTPDGRPGWAQRLVEAGYAVVLVDRPGQGRSPFHPRTMGEMGPPFSHVGGRKIYLPEDPEGRHEQWPFDASDEAAMDTFIAAYASLPADLAFSEVMEADRLAELLDGIGPAILLTHPASGSVGWLVPDRRPGLVKAIVAVEPMGPPFADTPNIGKLTWGLTASPLGYEPTPRLPEEAEAAPPGALSPARVAGPRIAAVVGETSSFAAASPPTVDSLEAAGAAAELVRFYRSWCARHGHGLTYEENSDAALPPILAWIARLEGQRVRPGRPSGIYK